jgi:hypothetical protein
MRLWRNQDDPYGIRDALESTDESLRVTSRAMEQNAQRERCIAAIRRRHIGVPLSTRTSYVSLSQYRRIGHCGRTSG